MSHTMNLYVTRLGELAAHLGIDTIEQDDRTKRAMPASPWTGSGPFIWPR